MNELSKKRIFLTGGTGLFGKWLLDRCKTLETELVVLSRNPQQFLRQSPAFGKNKNITFIQGDVRDFNFPDGPFDYVIHAATETGAKLEKENPTELYSVIVDGTRRVLEFSRQTGIKRLLYVSSGAVYGVQPPELSHIPETFPCNPVTVYGKGKLQAEQMCLASGIETVIVRPFAFVGPWLPLDAHFAIGNFIGNCLRNEPVEIKGDGTPLRSYMYGSDLADWLLTLLLKGRFGEAYNVGSEEAISIANLARLVRSVSGAENEIRVAQETVRGASAMRYIPSTQKIFDELGLRLQIELKNAIDKTVCWYLFQRKCAQA
ncbi:MAG: NAD(P)-dependent oxidoreductase [Kiritimatiellales bacterium]